MNKVIVTNLRSYHKENIFIQELPPQLDKHVFSFVSNKDLFNVFLISSYLINSLFHLLSERRKFTKKE